MNQLICLIIVQNSLKHEFFQVLIIKSDFDFENFFQVMFSLLKVINYDEKLFIVYKIMNFKFRKLF